MDLKEIMNFGSWIMLVVIVAAFMGLSVYLIISRVRNENQKRKIPEK